MRVRIEHCRHLNLTQYRRIKGEYDPQHPFFPTLVTASKNAPSGTFVQTIGLLSGTSLNPFLG
jgi:hypothetical protein